ncbi:uncharacterized protein LOC142170426 [Nicotiana tabacum]|uniref:Uncharacterized protein LOC142170426 n=1 Tax=Nicotiana tabacum TaxID=4097 RepID=A0AC58STZ1_TOBAC
MELLSLKTGLQLACERNLLNLEIETDGTDIIRLLDGDTCSIYSNLITECRSLLKKLENPPIQHNFREGNKVAHFLATQGSKQANNSPLSLLEQPPNAFLKIVHDDKIGSTKSRLVSSTVFTNLVELGNSFVPCNLNVNITVAASTDEPNGILALCNRIS